MEGPRSRDCLAASQMTPNTASERSALRPVSARPELTFTPRQARVARSRRRGSATSRGRAGGKHVSAPTVAGDDPPTAARLKPWLALRATSRLAVWGPLSLLRSVPAEVRDGPPGSCAWRGGRGSISRPSVCTPAVIRSHDAMRNNAMTASLPRRRTSAGNVKKDPQASPENVKDPLSAAALIAIRATSRSGRKT